MLRLDLDRPENQPGIRSRLADIYDQIAGGTDHERNEKSLGQIQFCVITVSAVATGLVNSFAHRERLTLIGAILLAGLIMGFVERFYFTLRHGLMTTYRTRRQRFAAWACYRLIQITMALNAAVLCAWVTGQPLPHPLRLWYEWSITIHFLLALIGIPAVRDSDSVSAHRIRELKAAAAEQDILAIRRAAAGNHPLLLLAARVRGWLDGMSLAYELIRDNRDDTQFANHYISETTPGLPPTYLPENAQSITQPDKVTGISGKRRRW